MSATVTVAARSDLVSAELKHSSVDALDHDVVPHSAAVSDAVTVKSRSPILMPTNVIDAPPVAGVFLNK